MAMNLSLAKLELRRKIRACAGKDFAGRAHGRIAGLVPPPGTATPKRAYHPVLRALPDELDVWLLLEKLLPAQKGLRPAGV